MTRDCWGAARARAPERRAWRPAERRTEPSIVEMKREEERKTKVVSFACLRLLLPPKRMNVLEKEMRVCFPLFNQTFNLSIIPSPN